MQQLSPGAWDLLRARGYNTTSPSSAYSILTALAEQENTDRTRQIVLQKLRTVLDDPYTLHPWRRKQDAWRLVKQLQHKRKLHNLRNKFGHIIQDPEAFAAKIVQYWQQTMRAEGASVPECKHYLSQFFSTKTCL